MTSIRRRKSQRCVETARLLHNAGYTKLSRSGVAATNVVSTSRMRGLAEDILSDGWEKLVGGPGNAAKIFERDGVTAPNGLSRAF
jgi:hypothetical protein